ncbi:MAG: hypothetical protein KC897_02285 [Candidatus Omnitrophica bacterium]|nr:hypothetical protein [Candidatus Omnitrophota bacterium]MCB9721068.1 hypothetical protein [Candidatus Omnitrophota bacterium]
MRIRLFTGLCGMVLLLTCVTVPADAAKDPNRVTTMNKIGDWFATVGKDDTEKRRILLERRKSRQERRVFKAHQKQQKRIQKQMRSQQRQIMETVDKKRMPHGRGGIDARE